MVSVHEVRNDSRYRPRACGTRLRTMMLVLTVASADVNRA
jgi:hypothetical protein